MRSRKAILFIQVMILYFTIILSVMACTQQKQCDKPAVPVEKAPALPTAEIHRVYVSENIAFHCGTRSIKYAGFLELYGDNNNVVMFSITDGYSTKGRGLGYTLTYRCVIGNTITIQIGKNCGVMLRLHEVDSVGNYLYYSIIQGSELEKLQKEADETDKKA